MNKIVINLETKVAEEVPLTPEEEAVWAAEKLKAEPKRVDAKAVEIARTDVAALYDAMPVEQRAEYITKRLAVERALDLGDLPLAEYLMDAKSAPVAPIA